jgi:hypothetical protein
LIFETIRNYKKQPKQLGRFEEKKNLYFSTEQKNFLNILGLLCRVEEINIFVILPEKKPL